MSTEFIYFVDESENDRFANGEELKALFCNTDFEVVSEAPLDALQDYIEVVAGGHVVAFMLDQNMRVGGCSYDGIDLARFIRNMDANIPIYIITASTVAIQDIGSEQYIVDDVIEKRDISNPESDKARRLRYRLLRHMELRSAKYASERNRFGELLRKKLEGAISQEEEAELDQIDRRRISDAEVAEYASNKSLADIARIVSTLAGKYNIKGGV